MKKLLKKAQAGFTLIELLVVVGILSILAVTALIAINPAEAQRKARDTQRLKDIGTLQTIVEQYIADNITTVTTAITRNSVADGGATKQLKMDCATTGWLGLNACAYANTVPIDPANRAGLPLVTSSTTLVAGSAGYQVLIDSNARYRICTRLESKANVAKLAEDGTANNYFELYSATDSPICTI